jgi:hypothetical protein
VIASIETAQKRENSEKNREYVPTGPGADPGDGVAIATDSFMYRRHPPMITNQPPPLHQYSVLWVVTPSATFRAKFLDQRLT